MFTESVFCANIQIVPETLPIPIPTTIPQGMGFVNIRKRKYRIRKFSETRKGEKHEKEIT